jgi:hypothetical protein
MFSARAETAGARKALAAMAASLPDAIGHALERTAALAVGVAKGTRRFNDRTGRLRASITAAPAGKRSIRVAAKTPYARAVEQGSRAHDIVASAGKMLRFVIGGATFYRHHVHHPGTKPRPFMADTARDMAPVFTRQMVDAVDAAFRAHARG